MLRGGSVLWNYEIDNPECRPFFHPLALPSGKVFTGLRPKDHIWHLGYWFCWKYINGVNYWEPADAGKMGVEPAGRTCIRERSVRIDSLDCVVTMAVDYGARSDGKTVLREKRTVRIRPPDEKGGYAIETRHVFAAMEDVVLDRTPPKGDPKEGRWSGGYAGETLRLSDEAAAAFDVRGFSGGKCPAEVTGTETAFLDFVDRETGEGVMFSQVTAPKTSRFYIWKDKRMVNASPVYAGPVSLGKGETLELSYRLKVSGGDRSGQAAKGVR